MIQSMFQVESDVTGSCASVIVMVTWKELGQESVQPWATAFADCRFDSTILGATIKKVIFYLISYN